MPLNPKVNSKKLDLCGMGIIRIIIAATRNANQGLETCLGCKVQTLNSLNSETLNPNGPNAQTPDAKSKLT